MRTLRGLLFFAMAAVAAPQELAEVRNVYILPMANGVDQYLAGRITRMGLFRVVTDPKVADAIFTENVGPGFADKWEELYAPPKPPEAPVAKKDAAREQPAPPVFGDIRSANEPREVFRPKTSAWGRGKGNIFLVGRQSRVVIWAAFDKPRDNRPKSLDEMASHVVRKLAAELKSKQ